MAGEKEFQQRIQQMGDSIRELDEVADPATRTKVKVLIHSLMEMHSAAFEKALEIVFDSGDSGQQIIDRLGHDPLVGSLLVLYGLHPEDIETRVAKAVERLRPLSRKQGSAVELLANKAGVVRLQVQVGGHACGSTTAAIKTSIEETIYEAAPDIVSLEIEGLDGKPSSGFVAIDALIGTAAPHAGETVAMSGEGAD